MSVYVDNMRAKYRGMTMCHMLADTDEELHAMAAAIGVARKWHQKPGTAYSHYDICLSMRAKAVKLGAVEIDRAALADLLNEKHVAAGDGVGYAVQRTARNFAFCSNHKGA